MPDWVSETPVFPVYSTSPSDMTAHYGGSFVDASGNAQAPAGWLLEPASLDSLADVPVKYWKIVGNDVAEMTQAEKDAVDAQILDDKRNADAVDAAGVPEAESAGGQTVRAIFATGNEGVWRIDRRLLEEIVATFTAIKSGAAASTGSPAARLDAIVAAIPDERARQSSDNPLVPVTEWRYVPVHATTNELMRAYRDNVEAGNVKEPPNLDDHEVPDDVKGNGAQGKGGR